MERIALKKNTYYFSWLFQKDGYLGFWKIPSNYLHFPGSVSLMIRDT